MTRRIRAGLTIAVSALVAGAALLVGAPNGMASSGVPYTDPAATGSIGLCSASGQALTSGSTTTTPFVWKAVSTAAAMAPYSAPGRTATLYAFQPRQNVPPGEWSGSELTAASRYTNPSHPMTAATRLDESLADFLQAYPASWHGLVQLRMYLGAPDHPIDSVNYAATDLEVSGTTWHAVDAGQVSCGGGKAVSVESLLLPSTEQVAPPVLPSHARSGGHSSHGASGRSAAPGAAVSGGGAQPSPGSSSIGGSSLGHSSADAHPSGSSDRTTSIAIVAVLVVILAAGSVLRRRQIQAVRARTSRLHVSKHRTNTERGRQP